MPIPDVARHGRDQQFRSQGAYWGEQLKRGRYSVLGGKRGGFGTWLAPF